MYTEEKPYAATRRCIAVTPTPEDLVKLMTDVRELDRDEWVAWSGHPMKPMLEGAVFSSPCLVICRKSDRYPLACFGAGDGGDGKTGVVWFAGTNKGYEYIPDLAVLTDAAIDFLHLHFEHLIAFSDGRNFDHHQWLATLGFSFTGCVDAGPWQIPFWRVERWKDRSTNECVRP